MRWNQIEGNWNPFDGCETRAELNHDENKLAASKREILMDKLQEGLGIAQGKAERRISDFGRTTSNFFIFSSDSNTHSVDVPRTSRLCMIRA